MNLSRSLVVCDHSRSDVINAVFSASMSALAQPANAASSRTHAKRCIQPPLPAHRRVGLDEIGLVRRRGRICAAFEIEKFDLPEIRWRRFRLNRDVAGGQ